MLRVPAAAERAVWALVRACIAAGGHLRLVAEGVVDGVKPPPDPPLPGQRALWVVDAEGLPPRPWRLQPEDVFDCLALGCRGLPVRVCVARQVASEIQRTQQSSRGQGTDHPTCQTQICAQGRGIREALDPRALVGWQGAGPGGRFQRERSRKARAEQDAARARKERAGLLDVPRLLDHDPDPQEER